MGDAIYFYATQNANPNAKEHDPDAAAAKSARLAYQATISALVTRLGPKDFEVLVDLILSRAGWTRAAANQVVLDNYVSRFLERRERYARMIFAVHSPRGSLKSPANLPIQVWNDAKVSELVVGLGLCDWVAKRIA